MGSHLGNENPKQSNRSGEAGRFELLSLCLMAAILFAVITFAAGDKVKEGDQCQSGASEQKECTAKSGGGGSGDSGGDSGGGGAGGGKGKGKGKGKKKAGEGPKCCTCGESKKWELKKSEKGGPGGSCDNANKGGDGKMPEMPQIPQKKEEEPQKEEKKTEYPSDTAINTNTDTTRSAPEIASSNLKGDEKGAGSINGVQFSQMEAGSASGISEAKPGASGPAIGNGPNGQKGRDSQTSSPFGGAAPGSGFGSTGGGGTGAGGGSGDKSGASQQGDIPKDKADANPFEMNMGGGRLSVPKGKTGGGDADSIVDAKATNKFEEEFKGPKDDKSKDAAGATEDVDDGYTIFKMISHKYSELKKRGSI